MSNLLDTCKSGTGAPLDGEHVSMQGLSSWPNLALLGQLFLACTYACRYSAAQELPRALSALAYAAGFEAAHRDGGSLTHARGLLPP